MDDTPLEAMINARDSWTTASSLKHTALHWQLPFWCFTTRTWTVSPTLNFLPFHVLASTYTSLTLGELSTKMAMLGRMLVTFPLIFLSWGTQARGAAL